MKSCIVLIFICLLFELVSGNEFRYLRSENGLPEGEINSIVQDSAGYMWFATWSGLIRYDGHQIKIFRPNLGDLSGLPEKKIKKLFVDSKDNLWIASSMNLSRLNRKNNTFHTYKFQDIGIRGINIINLLEHNNHLVVHAVEGIFTLPLSEKDNPDRIFVRQTIFHKNSPVDYYLSISSSAGDRLVFIHNSHDNSKSSVFIISSSSDGRNLVLQLETMLELKNIVNDVGFMAYDNTVYFATPEGLVPYSLNKKQPVKEYLLAGNDIQMVYCASNNRIYGSVRYANLLYVDLHTGLTGRYEANPNKAGSLLDNEIQALYEDFSGNLWIGHQGQGISIMNLYRKKFYSFRRDLTRPTTLNSNTVMCFNGTMNEILIGCRTNGLNIISKNQTTIADISYERYPAEGSSAGTLNDGIWDIARQSDTLFWLAAETGLYRLEKTRAGWNYYLIEGNINMKFSFRKVFIDSNNNLWCGSHGHGLFFIPNPSVNSNGIVYQYTSDIDQSSLSDDVIIDIFLDSKNNFWIGTNNGLNQLEGDYENLDLSGKVKPELKFKRYVAIKPQADFLNNNEINCLFENYDGNLWIATQGGGINILNHVTGKFSHITMEQGLPSNDVISMIPDEDGYLWIGTNKGLARFSRFQNNPSISVFSSVDGIQGEIFMVNSYYKAVDGQLFFGGDKGFTCFYPREIKINEMKPKISFTELKIRNKLVEVGDTLYGNKPMTTVLNEIQTLELPYKNNVFSVGVSALHFQHPIGNSIIYTLEGLYQKWISIPAAAENIYLSNLPPGKYVLKAKAVSSDGIISDSEKQMNIVIFPPWYKTRLAFATYFLLAFFCLYVIVHLLLSREKSAFQKKVDKIALESNESKMVFLTNIAHELRTPLSLIIGPVEDLVKNVPADHQWKNHLQIISKNTKYLMRLINQIIDFRKLNAGKLTFNPQQTDVGKIVKEVALNFSGYKSSRNINLQLNLPTEPLIALVDVQKYEEILYNLISNAYKYTYDNHSIIVTLKLSEKENINGDDTNNLHLTVFNEGICIEEKDQERIFERFYKVNEQDEGAGIGLSFTKMLVEMHKGSIHVESSTGKGVAFHVVIPAGKIETDTVPEVLPVLQTKSFDFKPDMPEVGKENGAARILVVEDNTELEEFLVNVFSRNYTCLSATSGSEAWRLLQQYSFSLVITDIILPELDGLDLCRKIKGNMDTCHIPVLLLTAKDSQEQIAEGYSVGADSYVTKPFDIEVLLSQAARLIQNRKLIKEKYISQNFMVEVQSTLSSREEDFLQAVRRYLEENLSDPELSVNSLSVQMNISTTQLYRRVKEMTGFSPVEFIRILRLQKAYSLLNARSHTVKEVCYLTGFNNISYFIKCFREHFGVTPASFRDRKANVVVDLTPS